MVHSSETKLEDPKDKDATFTLNRIDVNAKSTKREFLSNLWSWPNVWILGLQEGISNVLERVSLTILFFSSQHPRAEQSSRITIPKINYRNKDTWTRPNLTRVAIWWRLKKLSFCDHVRKCIRICGCGLPRFTAINFFLTFFMSFFVLPVFRFLDFLPYDWNGN